MGDEMDFESVDVDTSSDTSESLDTSSDYEDSADTIDTVDTVEDIPEDTGESVDTAEAYEESADTEPDDIPEDTELDDSYEEEGLEESSEEELDDIPEDTEFDDSYEEEGLEESPEEELDDIPEDTELDDSYEEEELEESPEEELDDIPEDTEFDDSYEEEGLEESPEEELDDIPEDNEPEELTEESEVEETPEEAPEEPEVEETPEEAPEELTEEPEVEETPEEAPEELTEEPEVEETPEELTEEPEVEETPEEAPEELTEEPEVEETPEVEEPAEIEEQQEKTYESLSDYMNDHNYGREDFDTYSQDSQWRELVQKEYPDYELPPLKGETTEESQSSAYEYTGDDAREKELFDLLKQDAGEYKQEESTDLDREFARELGNDFEKEVLDDPELTDEQKQSMMKVFHDTSDESSQGTLLQDVQAADFKDSNSDTAETRPSLTAMEQSQEVVERYNKVYNNSSLARDSEGYQIAMNEMSKDLGNQAMAMDSAISEGKQHVAEAEAALADYRTNTLPEEMDDAKYMELSNNVFAAREEVQKMEEQKSYLQALQETAASDVSEQYKGVSFRSANGKSFTDSYGEMINEQGAAYPDEILNDCGVCTMGNLANQRGDYYTESSALAKGMGNFEYTQITDDMTADEKAYYLASNGLTNVYGQANILNQMGYEAATYENGASFQDIVDNISKGNPMSVNLYGGDLNSGEKIAKRNGGFLPGIFGKNKIAANHAVTIAGLTENSNGEAIGFFVNDTGGYGGTNNPSIYISKAKYEQMLKRTSYISSVACTGRR